MEYSFQLPDGSVITRPYPMVKAPKLGTEIHVVVGDRVQKAIRILDAVPDHVKPPGQQRRSAAEWPKKPENSCAMGVHPNQTEKMDALCRRRGVPTEWDKRTGNPVIRDPAHYRNLRRALGYRDYLGYNTT